MHYHNIVKMQPIVWNSGSLTSLPRSISILSVQAPAVLNTKPLYQLDFIGDQPSGIIPLAVHHKIDHKYPKLMMIPLLHTENNTVNIPRKNVIGNLQPIAVEDFEVSSFLWTTDDTADTANCPMQLQCMLPESSFQPEQNNMKHSIVLQDAHIPQKSKDGLSSLIEEEYNIIISKSPTDVGRQIFSKWISQLQDQPLHINHT